MDDWHPEHVASIYVSNVFDFLIKTEDREKRIFFEIYQTLPFSFDVKNLYLYLCFVYVSIF